MLLQSCISLSLNISLYIYIHIYIYRERERCTYVYIYIYMYCARQGGQAKGGLELDAILACEKQLPVDMTG